MRHRILNAWAIALVAASFAATGAVAQTGVETRPARPDGAALVRKAIDSLGGAEAFKALDTARFKVTYRPSPTVGLDFEVWRSGADKIVASTAVPGRNLTFHLGLVGDVAWIRMGTGAAQKTGEAQVKQASEMIQPVYTLTDLLAGFETIETVREEGTGEAARWIIRFSGAKDPGRWGLIAGRAQPPVELVVNQTTGRPEALLRPGRTAVVLEERFEEPKPFGDLTIFTRVIRRDGRREQVLEYVEVDLDFDDASRFAIPENIARTLEPAGTPPAEDPQRP